MYTEGLGDTAFHGESDESDYENNGGYLYVPAIRAPLSCQDFEYYWNEELVVLYHQLKDTCASQGFALFETLDFCDFCKFAYVKSSKTKPSC